MGAFLCLFRRKDCDYFEKYLYLCKEIGTHSTKISQPLKNSLSTMFNPFRSALFASLLFVLPLAVSAEDEITDSVMHDIVVTGTRTAVAEQAILPTVKSDAGIAIPGFGIPLPGAAAGTVDFDPVENILNGDKLFPLSAEEAVSAAYGFAGNASRVALYKDAANGYWLRSPHIPTFPLDVGFVFSFGAIMDYPVNAKSMFAMDTYARPACNLDRASITGLEPLSVISSKTIWRVTFQGDGLSEQVYDLHLPEITKVPDVQRIISIVLIALPVFLLALVGMTIWLILRRVRKKRKAFQSTLLKGA
jgi:hypothetical protein